MTDELPPGWADVALSDVVSRPRSKVSPEDYPDLPFVGMDHIAANGMDLLGSVPFGSMKSNGGLFLEGDVLYGRMRPYLNKVHRAKTRGACSAEFIVFPQSDAIDSDLLAFLLHHRRFVNFACSKSAGDRPRVDFDDLSSYEFALPPKSEQKRIVSKIDELFSRIDEGERALERVQKLVERYRQSVLKAAVTGELTRGWREKNRDKFESGEALLARILKARREAWEKTELYKTKAKGITPANDKWTQRYKEPSRPDIGDLRDLPHGWTWATVEQISTKVVDGVHSKPNYVPSGIPFVTVKNLTAGPGISFDRLNYITATDHADFIKRTDPERGDVLISKDGTLGVVRVIQTETIFSIFVSVALVKPVVRTMGDYVGMALSSPIVQAQMVPKGSGLQHIHLEDLRRDCIPLPCLEEQQVIVDLVATQMASIDRVEADLVAYTKKTRSLRQSVLSSAFSGSLLPQSPDDEGASTLLTRIAAERSEATAKPKRGRKPKTPEPA